MTKIKSSKEAALRIRKGSKDLYNSTTFDLKDNISQRQAAKKFDLSQQMVSKLLKKLQITPRKKMKIPDLAETQKKMMNPISLSVMVKSMEIIYFTQITLLQHQQVQNIPQLRNLSRNYVFDWSFHTSYEKVDLQSTKLSI
ncbi:hypothetical protein BpHYR1_000312 [Brachionus plicatilis]|uniref:Uncharacterized protein n=1 Tax=Brachionus plicatilis TaxID=10195 RepID=A0A3M7SHX3_BRAPC|nr:hypothetical protein BpHYR1_000312 [Brachionus plicatilis]